MADKPMPGTDDDAHCSAFVRERDRDHYLAGLFAPPEKRCHLNALHAFAADLAAIKSKASEPLLGQVRLQWWRDSLNEMIAGTTIGMPIANALARAIAACELPAPPFEAMIEAREAELDGDHLASLAGFEDHLSATDGAVIELGVQVLTGDGNGQAVARPAGIALGLTRTLARLPAPSAGMDLLPRDILKMHGAGGDTGPNDASPALKAAMDDLIATARHHLEAARRGWSGLAPASLPALLPLATIEPDLRRVERAPYSGASGRLRRQWAIWRAARRGRL